MKHKIREIPQRGKRDAGCRGGGGPSGSASTYGQSILWKVIPPPEEFRVDKGTSPGRPGGIQRIHDNFALVQILPKLEQSHLNTTVP